MTVCEIDIAAPINMLAKEWMTPIVSTGSLVNVCGQRERRQESRRTSSR
jgi:hypothetical protein